MNPVFSYEGNRHLQPDQLHNYIVQSGLVDYLHTADDRAALIDSLTSESYATLLVDLHEAVTGRSDDDQIMVNGANFIINPLDPAVDFEIMPAHEDKQLILDGSLATAQETNNLTLKAMVLAHGVTAAHAFPDGNGRLARSLYYLLTRDYQPNDSAFTALLSENGDELMPLHGTTLAPIVRQAIVERYNFHDYNAVTGVSQPRIQLAMEDATFAVEQMLEIEKRGNEPLTPREVVFTGLANDQLIRETLPVALQELNPSPAVINSMITDLGKTYLLCDRFLKNASEQDIDFAYNFYRTIKVERAAILLRAIGFLDLQDWRSATPTVEHGMVEGSIPQSLLNYVESVYTIDTAYYKR